jgi:hypothetical protein
MSNGKRLHSVLIEMVCLYVKQPFKHGF